MGMDELRKLEIVNDEVEHMLRMKLILINSLLDELEVFIKLWYGDGDPIKEPIGILNSTAFIYEPTTSPD
jgi:hypothetical protein